MSRLVKIGDGTKQVWQEVCAVCEREFIGGGYYCSVKCRDTAKLERRHTRYALRIPLSFGFTLAFEDRSRAMVIVPDYLEEFFPKNSSQFYVFGKHDVAQSVLFENDITDIFIANVGSQVWSAMGKALENSINDEKLRQRYLLGAVEYLASSGIHGFTCSSCKRTLLKNGISASDCTGKCYRCCSFDRPF